MWIDDYRLVAHRGLHENGSPVPENSLPAFERAVTRGQGVEFDVHRTRDGRLAVFHDYDLRRMTGVEGVVEEQTLDELRAMRLLGTDCCIPALEEVLEVIGGKVPIILEIKNDKTENVGRLEPLLMKVLAEYQGKLVLESFNPRVVAWLRECAPQYIRGQLACLRDRRDFSFYVRHFLFNPLTQPQFIAYDIDSIDWRVKTNCRRHNVPLIAWTVRTAEQLNKARRLCDGIIYEGLEL